MCSLLVFLIGIVTIKTINAGLCPSTELFQDPNNCSQFIQCQGTKEVVMHCPDNLNFDPHSQTCEYPQNIILPDHYCEYDDMFYEKRHYCDCMKFVLCNFGEPTVTDCTHARIAGAENVDNFNYKEYFAVRNVCQCD